MRIVTFLLLTLVFSTSMFAQKRKKKPPKPVKIDTLVKTDPTNPTIKHLTILKNEVKTTTGTLLGEQKEGVWKTYHRNGQLANLSEYRNGELIGVSIDFSEKGVSTGQVNHQFANDTVTVTDKQNPDLQNITIYGELGKLLQTGSTLKGEKTGVWRDFRANGNITKAVSFIEGKENGDSYVFDKNGGIREKANYIDGLLSGLKITYKSVGKNRKKVYFPVRKERFKEGKLDGETMAYYKKDKPQEVTSYVKGKKHGSSKWYYKSGELLSDSEYDKGVLTGVLNTYYKNGQVKTTGKYRNNKPHDEYKSFYEDGVLESDGKYIEGKKDGKWTYYNKEEKAVKREWYENGKMTKVKE